MADVWMKQGDTGPPLVRTLLDADDQPVDLDGADVRFKMRRIHGYDTIDAEAVVLQEPGATEEDPPTQKGQVSYDWSEGGTEAAGGFYAEFEVTFGTNEIQTFPNGGRLMVAVLADLDVVTS